LFDRLLLFSAFTGFVQLL